MLTRSVWHFHRPHLSICVNEVGNKLEKWGVKELPTDLVYSKQAVMGSKDLNHDQKMEILDDLEKTNAFEVNKKWDDMQKQIADYVM